jgi:hypothetical protein
MPSFWTRKVVSLVSMLRLLRLETIFCVENKSAAERETREVAKVASEVYRPDTAIVNQVERKRPRAEKAVAGSLRLIALHIACNEILGSELSRRLALAVEPPRYKRMYGPKTRT